MSIFSIHHVIGVKENCKSLLLFCPGSLAICDMHTSVLLIPTPPPEALTLVSIIMENEVGNVLGFHQQGDMVWAKKDKLTQENSPNCFTMLTKYQIWEHHYPADIEG